MLYLGGFTGVAMACGVLALAVLPETSWPAARALQWGPLRVLGVVSYAVYLWHLPVFVATQRYLADVAVAGRAVIACTITAILTSLSWFLVERPFLRWKSDELRATLHERFPDLPMTDEAVFAKTRALKDHF